MKLSAFIVSLRWSQNKGLVSYWVTVRRTVNRGRWPGYVLHSGVVWFVRNCGFILFLFCFLLVILEKSTFSMKKGGEINVTRSKDCEKSFKLYSNYALWILAPLFIDYISWERCSWYNYFCHKHRIRHPMTGHDNQWDSFRSFWYLAWNS